MLLLPPKRSSLMRQRDLWVPIDPAPPLLRYSTMNKDALFWVSSDPKTSKGTKNELLYETTQELMETLAVEAFKVALVRSKARIVEGDAGKVICREAERIKPAAVVMGTRGRGVVQRVLHGSVSDFCSRHCKAAPVIIVPGKEAGDQSVI
ncbi:uncharacterized protein LOC141826173 isoform X2 [Curcuma longa]|uniref:uncharacterized protein LOC141826173 isoform X2 n=1 Tax=Curcuma longa TaxID=136217 RepID=UPI003D9F4E10